MDSIDMHPHPFIYTISVILPSANKTYTVHAGFCSTIFSGLRHIVLAKILLFNSQVKKEEKISLGDVTKSCAAKWTEGS